MKLIRFIVGRIIFLLDFLTRPSPAIRSRKDQVRVDVEVSGLSLYQFKVCPFCIKVRRQMTRRSIQIELKDAKTDLAIKEELVREGGKHKVPCLRIEEYNNDVRGLYSSDEICKFLDAKLDQLKVI